MKKRLAKKIMSQQPEIDIPLHRLSSYWRIRWVKHYEYVLGLDVKRPALDHRITKAINITYKSKF